MKVDTVEWTNRIVLLGLVSINVVLISNPTIQLFDGSTLFVTKKEATRGQKPFQWPSLVICRNPIIKNQTSFETFMETFDPEAEKDAFFTNASDFLYDVAIASDFLTMFTDTSIRWPLQPPYVSTFLGEYQYKGYCLEIALESIRKEKIKRGELDENDPDTRFSVVLWLKGLKSEQEKYAVDILEDGETGLITTGDKGLIDVKGNHGTLLQLEFEREQRIKECSAIVDSMTNCIMKALKAKWNTTFESHVDLGFAQINGIDFLANYTGCSRPCDRTIYKAKEFYASPLKNMVDSEMKKPFPATKNNQSDGTLLIINHVRQSSYSKYQEQYNYDVQSWISDTGGITGIFLGISFWSFYEMLLQPFIKKMQELLKLPRNKCW